MAIIRVVFLSCSVCVQLCVVKKRGCIRMKTGPGIEESGLLHLKNTYIFLQF